MRPKKSKIWFISSEDLAAIIKDSHTLQEAMSKIGERPSGGNHKALRARMEADGLSYNCLAKCGTKIAKERSGKAKEFDMSRVLVAGSSYARSNLKRRLIATGILENRCGICKAPPEWNQQPLSLVLDHINGVHNDNRLENLRLLCPNCNSQTPTFSGRNRKYKHARIV